MSTKKNKPYRVAGAKEALLAQREAELAAARKRRRDTGITLLVVVAVLIGIVSMFGWYQATKKPDAPASPTATSSASLAFAPVTVTDGKGLMIGAARAPNVVTLYSDFACTHCAEFETTYGQTLADLRDSGRIDLEYYPLGFGSPGSARASNAMACAAERDPAFAVNLYDGFFANMGSDWSNDQILSLAQHFDPTLPQGFETCVTGGTHAAWVTGIFSFAKSGPAAGGTPALYVNGTIFDLTTGTPESLAGSLS